MSINDKSFVKNILRVNFWQKGVILGPKMSQISLFKEQALPCT